MSRKQRAATDPDCLGVRPDATYARDCRCTNCRALKSAKAAKHGSYSHVEKYWLSKLEVDEFVVESLVAGHRLPATRGEQINAVIQLRAKGKTYKETAQILGIGERQVHRHIQYHRRVNG